MNYDSSVRRGVSLHVDVHVALLKRWLPKKVGGGGKTVDYFSSRDSD